MANNDGSIIIKGELDLSKIEDSVTKLQKRINDAAVEMGISIEGLTDKIKNDFAKMDATIKKAGKNNKKNKLDIETDDLVESFDLVTKEIRALQKEITSGEKDIEEYTQEYAALERRLRDVAEQALITGKRLPKSTMLSSNQINKITGGKLSENDIKGYSHPELLQAKEIIDAIRKTQKKSSQELEEYARIYTSINNQIKQQLLSEQQKREAIKKTEEAEKKAAKRRKKDELDAIKIARQLREEKERSRALDQKIEMRDANYNDWVKTTAALKKYRIALEGVDESTEDGKQKAAKYRAEISKLERQLNKTSSATKKMDTSSSTLANGFKNLMTRMAFYVSLGAIVNFGKQIVSVRAEFEKTTVALGAIIKDFDKANQLFLDVQQTALKSPFTIMELTQSTKQLAAYNIGVEDLHSTMKMLADLSAGVGTEMQRLVVNYGQIKALGVANNRELKDFAVAGLPVYEELAKRFTVLENRMVSAGEVFERVSNRMVSFQDVQAVLEGLTEEGGRFYNIQEEMSKTMAGRISNLADAWQLMFNEIGERGEGIILGMIKLIQNLAKNWEKFIPLVHSLGIALATLGLVKTVGLVFNIASAFKTAAWSAKAFGTALKTGSVSNPYILIITALASMVTYFIAARKEAERFNKELNEIYKKHNSNFKKLSENVENLALKLKNANEGSQEHKDLIVSISSKYGKYLDFVLSEETALDAVYNAREKVIDGLKREQMAKAQSEANSKILEGYAEDLTDGRTRLEQELARTIDRVELEDAAAIVNIWKKEIESGTKKTLEDVIKEYLVIKSTEPLPMKMIQPKVQIGAGGGVKGEEYEASFPTTLANNYLNIINNINDAQEEAAQSISEVFKYQSYSTKAQADASRKLDLQYDKLEKRLNKASEIDAERAKILEEQISLMEKEGALTKSQAAYLLKNNDIQNMGYDDSIKLFEKLKDIGNRAFKVNVEKIGSQKDLENYADEIIKWGDGIVNDVNKKLSEVGLDQDVLSKVSISEDDAKGGLKGLIEQSLGLYKSYKETEEMLDAMIKNNLALSEKQKSDYQNSKKYAEGYLALLKLLGVELEKQTTTGERGYSQVEILSDQLKLVTDITSNYRKLAGLSGDLDKSAKETKESYSELFNTLFQGTNLKITDLITFKNSDIVTFLDKMQSKVGASLPSIKMTINEEDFIMSFNDLQDKIEAIRSKSADLITDEDKQYLNAYAESVRVAANQKKKDLIKIQDAKAEVLYDIRVSVAEADLNTAQQQIDQLFTNYKVGVEIEAMGEYGDLMAEILDVDKINFKELDTKLNGILSTAVFKGNELAKDIAALEAKQKNGGLTEDETSTLASMTTTYNKQLDIVVDAENKIKDIKINRIKEEYRAQQEYLSQYATFQQQKYHLELEYAAKIKRAQDEGNIEQARLLSNQRNDAISSLNTQQIVEQINWEAAFGNAGDLLGSILKDTLSKAKEYLNTEEFRAATIKDKEAILDVVKKMEDTLGGKGGLNFKKLAITMSNYEKVVQQLINAKQKELDAITNLKQSQKDYNDALESGSILDMSIASAKLAAAKEDADAASLNVKTLTEISKESQQAVTDSAINLKTNMDGMVSGLSKIFSGDSLAGIWEGFIQIGDSMKDGSIFANMADKMKEVPIVGWILSILDLVKDGLVPILSNIGDLISGIIETAADETLSGDIFFAVQDLLTGILSSIWKAATDSIKNFASGDFFKMIADVATFGIFDLTGRNDKNAMEQAEEALEELKYVSTELEQSYARLQREAEKALGGAEIAAKKSAIAQQELIKQNLILQKQEYEKQLAYQKSLDLKEGSGDDTERDKTVKELEDTLQGVNHEIENMGWEIEDAIADITNELLGSDIKSAAEDFASSFIDAWKNGEDPFAVIEDGFDDMIDNLIMKSLASEIVAKHLKDVFKAVEKASVDNAISTDEIKEISGLGEEATQKIGTELKALMEALGIGFGSGAASGLSDLQKGIQGMTSEESGVLASLWTTEVANSFTLINLSTNQLATQNEILNQIRSGNTIKTAIQQILQLTVSEDGAAFRVDLR